MFPWRMLSAMLVAGGVHAAAARTIYVSLAGSNTPPFTNWSMAATNIQYAVNVASNGETILVTNGTYASTGQVALAKGVTLSSVNGPADTVIAGTSRDRCIYVAHSNALVAGFTLSQGHGWFGAGAYVDGAGVIRNCRVTGNTAAYGGGGIYLNGGGDVEQCFVHGNAVTNAGDGDAHGGGLFLNGGGSVRDCVVGTNTARKLGGGIYLTGDGWVERCGIASNSAAAGGGAYGAAGATLYACTVERNAASVQAEGGGVYLDAAHLVNCVVISNVAAGVPSSGGGVYAFGACTIQNCTIATNTAFDGGGLYVNATSAVRNTIVYFNTASFSPNYSNRYGSVRYTNCCTAPVAAGASNITGDPYFADMATADYRINYNSICVDAGHPGGAPVDDRNGLPRPLEGYLDGSPDYDIGAHEYASPAVDADGDGLSDGAEAYGYLTDPLDADTDDDWTLDGHEILAGTSPTNALSYFGIVSLDPRSETGGIVVTWFSAGGRSYRLERGSNAAAGYAEVVASNLNATAPMNTYTDAAAARAGPWVYRVGLE